jgi:hypothetical protein
MLQEGSREWLICALAVRTGQPLDVLKGADDETILTLLDIVKSSSKPTNSIEETKELLDDAFAVFLAHRYFLSRYLRFSRVQEVLVPKRGECKREITVLWSIPTLAEMGDEAKGGRVKHLILPLWIIRKGQLLTDLSISIDGKPARLISKHHSSILTEQVMLAEWRRAKVHMKDLGVSPDAILYLEPLVEKCVRSVVSAKSGEARRLVATLMMEFGQYSHWTKEISQHSPPTGLQLDQVASRFFATLKFLSKRQILWTETSLLHGEAIMISYSYSTRWAPEYSISEKKWHPRATAARFAGQFPAQYTIPIWRDRMAHSYHVVSRAPSRCHFVEYNLVSKKVALGDESQDNTAVPPGLEPYAEGEVGGTNGHAYAYDAGVDRDDRSYIHARIQETPPGALAPVGTLLTIGAAVAFLLWWRWDAFADTVSKSTFLAAAAVVIGLVGAWFARNIDIVGRDTVPMLARFGLLWMSMVTLVTLAAGMAPDDELRTGKFLWMNIRHVYGIFITCTTTIVAGRIWWMRIKLYRQYGRMQRSANVRYGVG